MPAFLVLIAATLSRLVPHALASRQLEVHRTRRRAAPDSAEEYVFAFTSDFLGQAGGYSAHPLLPRTGLEGIHRELGPTLNTDTAVS
jgi:hypothetical protein